MTEELEENIEVVTPGQILQEARDAKGLSVSDVANRLHLRQEIIENIEANKFEDMGSSTFTRGYVRAYTKLLGVNEDDVFSAFDCLNVAVKQSSEMQSFSRRTEKQTHDNRLMMISYMIIFVMLVLFVLWWWQNRDSFDFSAVTATKAPTTQTAQPTQPVQSDVVTTDDVDLANNGSESQGDTDNQTNALDNLSNLVSSASTDALTQAQSSVDAQEQANPVDAAAGEETQNAQSFSAEELAHVAQLSTNEQGEVIPVVKSKLTMMFSEDCWINVIDGDDERIAFGTKKRGYVMNVEGVAPFEVTICNPLSVVIQFNDVDVDTSEYPQRTVAKFEVPIEQFN